MAASSSSSYDYIWKEFLYLPNELMESEKRRLTETLGLKYRSDSAVKTTTVSNVDEEIIVKHMMFLFEEKRDRIPASTGLGRAKVVFLFADETNIGRTVKTIEREGEIDLFLINTSPTVSNYGLERMARQKTGTRFLKTVNYRYFIDHLADLLETVTIKILAKDTSQRESVDPLKQAIRQRIPVDPPRTRRRSPAEVSVQIDYVFKDLFYLPADDPLLEKKIRQIVDLKSGNDFRIKEYRFETDDDEVVVKHQFWIDTDRKVLDRGIPRGAHFYYFFINSTNYKNMIRMVKWGNPDADIALISTSTHLSTIDIEKEYKKQHKTGQVPRIVSYDYFADEFDHLIENMTAGYLEALGVPTIGEARTEESLLNKIRSLLWN